MAQYSVPHILGMHGVVGMSCMSCKQWKALLGWKEILKRASACRSPPGLMASAALAVEGSPAMQLGDRAFCRLMLLSQQQP